MKPWRNGVRALVLDPDDCVLLVHFSFPPRPWAAPGGGLDPGESDEHALRRELAEEVGLDEFELGPLLWTREHEAAEYVSEVRWWTQDELERSDEVFAPRRLAGLVRDLLDHGPPEDPPALGV